MAIVTLPHTAKANTDPNLFSEVKANDQAIIDQVNGNLDATNIAADSIGTSEIAANIITQSEVSTTFITSGTYTPTLTNISNITGSTVNTTHYTRVGSVVTVGFQLTIDPTGAGGIVLHISLPIASDLANGRDLTGTAANLNSNPPLVARITSDTASNVAELGSTVTSGNDETWVGTFMYRVL
jgi:hypothetical protein